MCCQHAWRWAYVHYDRGKTSRFCLGLIGVQIEDLDLLGSVIEIMLEALLQLEMTGNSAPKHICFPFMIGTDVADASILTATAGAVPTHSCPNRISAAPFESLLALLLTQFYF